MRDFFHVSSDYLKILLKKRFPVCSFCNIFRLRVFDPPRCNFPFVIFSSLGEKNDDIFFRVFSYVYLAS